MDVDRSEIFFEAGQLGCAGDGNDPRLLGQQPGERDLSGRGFLARGDLAKQIDQGLIGFASFGREARNDVAEVIFVEGGLLVDLSRQKTFA